MSMDSIEELKQLINEMEKRLRVAEDIEQIKQLHARFVNAHIFGDSQGEVDCFSEDGILDIPGGMYKGKEEIAKFTGVLQPEEEQNVEPEVTEGGFAIHPQIKVDGDTATGNWVNYNMFSYTKTMQSLFWMQGIFDCEYRRENGEWKISYSKWTLRIHPPFKQPGEDGPEL